MVELEKVTTAEDKKLLHEMITSHFMYTGSRNAKRILDSLGGDAAEVREGDAGRLQARVGRAEEKSGGNEVEKGQG